MHTRIRLVLAATIAVAFGVLTLFVRPGGDAGAEVVHGVGYQATVMGWTSWYGSYVLDGVGVVWCIDHGLRAPDVDYGYRPTAQPAIPEQNRTAMAWILARHGADPSRIDAAAVMLALHDLNGAVYPQGPLDLRSLSADRFAGFAGRDAAVFDRSVEILGDGLAHGSLRGPIRLTVTAPERARTGEVVSVTAALHDAQGRPVDGLWIGLAATGGRVHGSGGVTDAAGAVTVPVTMDADELRLVATATVPSLELVVHGPSGAPAQRVGSSANVELSAHATTRAPEPTTTTTTSTTTTLAPTTTTSTVPETPTTVPEVPVTVPETTTTVPATTTTVPETTTTVPATTTTVPQTTTTARITPAVPAPPRVDPPPTPSAIRPPQDRGELPRTGGRHVGTMLVGTGLILSGAAVLVAAGTRRRRV